jgi:hypothetical protein
MCCSAVTDIHASGNQSNNHGIGRIQKVHADTLAPIRGFVLERTLLVDRTVCPAIVKGMITVAHAALYLQTS